MTEEEFKKFLEEYQQIQKLERIKRETFGKQIDQGILKIPLEGFISIKDKLVLADNLEIEKVTSEVRDKFFQRAAGLELSDYRHENNWFFLTYKFDDERRRIVGIDTGNRILLVAIFFAVCAEKLIRINKSQAFVLVNGELSSIGISRIPNVPWSYESSATFETEDIEKLREFWPLFKVTYSDQTHFALVARRFYFSLIRNHWEDQLIDLIIALEALLVPEMDGVNKSGKIAKRLSRLLSKHYMRGEVSKITLSSYEIRNKIVHGKLDDIDINEVHTLKDQLRVYVKQAIQVYLLHYRNLTTQELADRLEQISGDQI